MPSLLFAAVISEIEGEDTFVIRGTPPWRRNAMHPNGGRVPEAVSPVAGESRRSIRGTRSIAGAGCE